MDKCIVPATVLGELHTSISLLSDLLGTVSDELLNAVPGEHLGRAYSLTEIACRMANEALATIEAVQGEITHG
ncbi:hypothetical protein WK39_03065 [Burkholderia cepacia]|uniref:hypothetical protein n=1 Tax=Burkholderia cepacia TaxID=292 RepID=UPI0007580521|nr:hypothetical protein [Burkholderia cepacia]KVS53272.1 hypothetical protein WK39_03065 [Burkholderia cepacia]KVS57736.1 hypothetical protein WK40_25515 [Burkholderia cepacia]CAG9268971.1 hypothetical protein BCEP4_540028 [Burkholderia cepacia]